MTKQQRGLLIAGAAAVLGYLLARRSVLPSTQFVGTSALPPGVPPLHTDWLTQARAANANSSGLALPPSQVVLASTPIGSGYVDLSAGSGGDFLYGDDPTVPDYSVDSGIFQ